ncbi:MAG: 16S rRNA (guanine(966)-N(2))-methyltransferase RsmD [Thermoleophilaceae bacterium]
MRVVAGAFKGRRLTAPGGRATRPTADRVREALFSMLGPIDGLRVLDLFAGSGALGVEAASRGAAAVTFVENDRQALEAIARNLNAVGLEAAVIRSDALAYLGGRPGPFDLVFVDPPYSSALRLTESLAERLPTVISEQARIVSESDKRCPLDLALPLLRERTYGDTRIAIHRVA